MISAANGEAGVDISGPSSQANLVQNNTIGLGSDETTPLGNIQSRCDDFEAGAQNNSIGGITVTGGQTVSLSNTIAANKTDGASISIQCDQQPGFSGNLIRHKGRSPP